MNDDVQEISPTIGSSNDYQDKRSVVLADFGECNIYSTHPNQSLLSQWMQKSFLERDCLNIDSLKLQTKTDSILLNYEASSSDSDNGAKLWYNY